MSKLTVGDVVGLGGLQGARVVAGRKGLGQKIVSISVLEVAETRATRWMIPDELYITSLFAIKDDVERQKSIVRLLAGCSCCGIVICHVGVLLNQVSDELIDLCNELNFPLIVPKPDNSYVDILKPIMLLLVSEDEGSEKRGGSVLADSSWGMSNLQNDLLELIINEQETKEIFRKINRRIHQKATYLDLYYDYIYSDKTAKSVEEERRHIHENFGEISRCHAQKELYIWPSEHGAQVISLIKTQYSLFGFVVIDCTNLNIEQDKDKLFEIISVICLTCPLILNRKEKMVRIQDFYQEEYLADLLVWNFRSEDVAVRRGMEYGIDLRGKNELIVVNVNSQQKSDSEKEGEIKTYVKSVIFPSIRDIIHINDNNGIVIYRSDTILIFLESKPQSNNLLNLSENILALFHNDEYNTVSIGIADTYRSLKDIPAAYTQAVNAAKIGRSLFGEGYIARYEDIWLYQKLKQFSFDHEMKRMCLRILKPLLDFDERHQSSLIDTLLLLITTNMDMGQVAEKLFIHRNTLLYRKKKIIEVLGYSPFVMPFMFNILFALHVLGHNATDVHPTESGV